MTIYGRHDERFNCYLLSPVKERDAIVQVRVFRTKEEAEKAAADYGLEIQWS